ncbi:WYL domain-containing protein [Nocardioides convexus]|uniref:WYL domain-containing protein n=1 Tax=Nocardioides convexus TaxID=2712224 RepID=UPI003100D75B
MREVARTGWSVHARLVIDAPAEEVLARINPAVGVVETRPDGRSVLVTGGDSLEVVAVWIGMLGLDFTVESPAALVDHLRVLAQRYAGAVVGSAP